MDNANHAVRKTPTNGLKDAVFEAAIPVAFEQAFEQPFAAAMFRTDDARMEDGHQPPQREILEGYFLIT